MEPQAAIERKFIVVQLGNETFGVDISHVRSIERSFAITPIPNTADFIEGITNLRDSVIPVIDLRKLLSMETTSSSTEEKRLLAATIKDRQVGLLVDSANEVIDIDPATVQPTPDIIKGGESPFIQGVAKLENRLLLLLDVDQLLTNADLAQLENLQ